MSFRAIGAVTSLRFLRFYYTALGMQNQVGGKRGVCQGEEFLVALVLAMTLVASLMSSAMAVVYTGTNPAPGSGSGRSLVAVHFNGVSNALDLIVSSRSSDFDQFILAIFKARELSCTARICGIANEATLSKAAAEKGSQCRYHRNYHLH